MKTLINLLSAAVIFGGAFVLTSEPASSETESDMFCAEGQCFIPGVGCTESTCWPECDQAPGWPFCE